MPTPKTKRKRRRPALAVESPTGTLHVFDQNALGALAFGAAAQDQAREQTSRQSAESTWQMLQQKKPRPHQHWRTTIERFKAYRIVEPPIVPLSTMGPWGCGGRVNIGKAQTLSQFPFKGSFGLYAALDIETARAEFMSAGLPSKVATVHELTLSQPRQLALWDLDAVVRDLSDSKFAGARLLDAVMATPAEASWASQKSPMASQILGEWLRNLALSQKTDGVVFQSTKRPEGKNIFLFFNDAGAQAEQELTAVDQGALFP